MKNCQVCNIEFAKPSKLSKKQWELRKFCSYKCFAKVTPLLQNKGRHPWNYRGVTTQNKLERTKFRSEVQKLVFERDNYQCVFCGSGGDLQVDHIQSWAEYPDLRFDIDNCRTLCVPCHYKLTFGRPIPDNIIGWGHHMLGGRLP